MLEQTEMTLGDNINIDEPLGGRYAEADYGSLESGAEDEEEGEETEEESEEEEAPAPKKQPKKQVATQTPQAAPSEQEVFANKYQTIRAALSALDGDEKVIDQIALGIASASQGEMNAIRKEMKQAQESMFYSTPLGREVAKVQQEIPGLGIQQAITIVRKARGHAMEKGRSKPRGPAEVGLSAHDKKICSVLKIDEAEYRKDLKDISEGKGVDYRFTRHGELVIDNV